MRTVVASSQGTAQASESRMAEAVAENDRSVRRAGQSDRAVSSDADSGEMKQQCGGDGKKPMVRWMGAPRILTVAEGA